MGTVERLFDSYFYAVYCNSVYHMEWTGKPFSLYSIRVKHLGILDVQSQKHPHRKSYLRFTLLAALRCSCPFLNSFYTLDELKSTFLFLVALDIII